MTDAYSNHVLVIVELVNLWIITGLHIRWPHEKTEAVASFEVSLLATGAVVVSAGLVELDSNPIALVQSTDLADVGYFASAAADNLAACPDLNVSCLIFLELFPL